LWTSTCPISGRCLLSAHCQPFCLSPLFTESLCGDQLLTSPPFSSALSATPPLLCVLVFSSLFIFQFLFAWGWGSVCPGGYAGLSQGWLGGIPHDARRSPVCSAECLPSRLGAGIWWWQQLSCFLSVMWCWEAFQELGV
jgi:hypothetical protein